LMPKSVQSVLKEWVRDCWNNRSNYSFLAEDLTEVCENVIHEEVDECRKDAADEREILFRR